MKLLSWTRTGIILEIFASASSFDNSRDVSVCDYLSARLARIAFHFKLAWQLRRRLLCQVSAGCRVEETPTKHCSYGNQYGRYAHSPNYFPVTELISHSGALHPVRSSDSFLVWAVT